MSADLRSDRNKPYRIAALWGGFLLVVFMALAITILGLLFSWRFILVLAASAAGLFILIFMAGLLLPLNIGRIVKEQTESLMDPLERRLLELALLKDTSQETLDDFLSGWDIEKAPLRSVMLLAYVMKTRPGLKFGAITPRLNGVLDYCRFQNLKREAHFSKVGEALGHEGIPFVILKGGAMKVYRPDFPRWMNDIDVIVPEKDYQRVVDLVMDLGYDKPMVTDHSVDLHLPGSDEGLIDIHDRLEMFTGKESAYNEGLFARAARTRYFSVDGLLPCREDMVFVAMVNLFKNLSKNQTPESSLTTFFDLEFLIGGGEAFDWGLVRREAERTGTLFQVLYVSHLVSAIIPGIIPDSMTGEEWMEKRDYEGEMIDFLLRRDVLSAGRDAVTSTKAGAALQRGWNPLVFMWVALASVIGGILKSRMVKRVILALRYSVR